MEAQSLLFAATGHHRAGRFEEAAAIYRQILAQQPNHADALNQLGYLLCQQEKPQEALDYIQHALAIDPMAAEYLNNAGLALAGLGRFEEAVSSYQAGLKTRPDLAEIHNNLGNSLIGLSRLSDARQALARALELRPHLSEAWDNLGQIFKLEGEYDRAIDAHRQAIHLRPDFAQAHFNLGLLLLLKGDLRPGWREADWRWRFLKSTVPHPLFEKTLWDGSDLNGRRILIHPEGGFGDTIHFVRFAPLVAGRGGKVLFGCPRELIPLIQNCEGIDEIIPSKTPVPPFDVHCPAASVAGALDITLENIPAKIPYLRVDPVRARYWQEKITPNDKRIKVGLVWAGRPDFSNDHNRSMPLTRFAPLTQIPNIWFFSLQKGLASEQLKTIPAGWNITDWTDRLKDYADTAALVSQLDLIISVDTSVAHVAGALGKPVWVFLPFLPDWRWMLDRSDTPWYPTMRLFRQDTDRTWDRPIQRIVEALHHFSRRGLDGRSSL